MLRGFLQPFNIPAHLASASFVGLVPALMLMHPTAQASPHSSLQDTDSGPYRRAALACADTLDVGPGHECSTIQEALDAAGSGDTITIYRASDANNNDCYNERLAIDNSLSNLTIQGATTTPASAACIGSSTAGTILTVDADGVTIKDLEISGKVTDGAGGTNGFGGGGRAAPPSGDQGAGIFITSDNVTIQNCTISFNYGDNIRFKGSSADNITIQGNYIHHSDYKRNIRIIGGNNHIIRNNLIHKGQGILLNGSSITASTIEKNIIQGWSYWGHLAGHASYPEQRDASHGGGWRYYSDCIAGIWIYEDATGATIQNNLVIGAWRGIRVGTTGTIRNNTVINPWHMGLYDWDGPTLNADDIRDNTVGIMIQTGFSGTIENNIVHVTSDQRCNGKGGQASTPYYTPGITGYGIAYEGLTGTLGGGAVRNNNVFGFVDTDGFTQLNYGTDTGSVSGKLDQDDVSNISVEPGFATDTSDETNGGSGPCDADAADTRCYELYWDNFFLSSIQGSVGSCHADIWDNTAGYVGFVDLSNGGANDPTSDDLSGLDDCTRADDSTVSRLIDLGDDSDIGCAGDGVMCNECYTPGSCGDLDYDLNKPNLGAYGRTDRASWSASLRIVGIDVGSGGVKGNDDHYSGPGIIQARDGGLTELNVWFNRPISAVAANFTVNDYCDGSSVTAPTISAAPLDGSDYPYRVQLTWPAGTIQDQGIYVTADGTTANKITDNLLGEDLDGELSDPDSGTVPSGNSTDGGDAEFRAYALVGDVDGDLDVDSDDLTAVNSLDGSTAGHLPEDLDGDATVEGAAAEDDYVLVDNRKADYWINTISDDGGTATSLRYAVDQIADNAGYTIKFKVDTFAPCNDATIDIDTSTITIDQDGVVIDAATPPTGITIEDPDEDLGAAEAALTITSDNNIVRGLKINSIGFSQSGYGLALNNAANNTLGGNYDGSALNQLGEGLLLNNTARMIHITGAAATGNVITGSLIGTDISGTADGGDCNDGVVVESDSNTIGGTTGAKRNIISGCGDGIQIEGADNVIIGNYIGTDINGTSAVGNTNGIIVYYASDNTIGGSASGEGNLISGNTTTGITLLGDADNNIVQGNLIGTDVNGTADLGNGTYGVSLYEVVTWQPDSNTIGGPAAGERNVISGNGYSGIEVSDGSNNVIQGNYIGTDASGTADIGNDRYGIHLHSDADGTTIGGIVAGEENIIAFNGDATYPNGIFAEGANTDYNMWRGNLVHSNNGAPIALNADGANEDLAAPTLTCADVDSVIGAGTATGATPATIDMYSNDDNDTDMETYLGASSAHCAGGVFELTGLTLTAGDYLVITQTDTDNNTSPQSTNVQVGAAGTCTLTPGNTASYYFDAYDAGGEEFETNPANMVDNNTGTSASSTTEGRVQRLTSNSYAGGQNGIITMVELRLHRQKIGGGASSHDLRPIFCTDEPCTCVDPNCDGANYNITAGGAPQWSSYVDITNDAAAPACWSWDDITNLDVDVVNHGSAEVYSVEVRITYSE